MKLAGVGLLAGLAVLSVHTRAEAECGNPHWVGTPTGATIPAKGSLYRYDESLAYRDPKSTGGPIVAQTKISDTVVRLDYVTKADELELSDEYEPTLLQVSPTWQPPAAAPRVIQYWHETYAWTCSSSNSVMLQIDQPTAAFRVFWQSRNHPAKTWIIPARTAENNINVLELGKVNCGSTSIDPDELAAGGILTLMAIRYDGSEVAVTGLPPTLSSAEMPTGDTGITRAIGYQAGAAPTASVPPVDHDFPFHLFLLLLIPAAALLFVASRHRALKPVV